MPLRPFPLMSVAIRLILNLRAPKAAWHTLSQVYILRGLKYTAATGLPFAPHLPREGLRAALAGFVGLT